MTEDICIRCSGDGTVLMLCGVCRGSGEGQVDGSICPECGKSGRVEVECPECLGACVFDYTDREREEEEIV